MAKIGTKRKKRWEGVSRWLKRKGNNHTCISLPLACWSLPVDGGTTYAWYRSIYYVPKHGEFLQRATPWTEHICFFFPDVQASGKACDSDGNWRERREVKTILRTFREVVVGELEYEIEILLP